MNKSIAEYYGIDVEQDSYAKGRQLEDEFSTFMRKKLGWEVTRVGTHLSGKDNRKGASVDIVGARLNKKGMAFFKAFKVYALTFVLFMAVGIFYGLIKTFNDGISGGVFVIGMFFELAGVIAIFFSSLYNRENALVECKNLKGKVNLNHIYKTLREIQDYKDSRDKEYKFKYHYFVSANGYVDNALKYANEHGIICFEKQNGKFVESEYWK